jgi:hypothetical protein
MSERPLTLVTIGVPVMRMASLPAASCDVRHALEPARGVSSRVNGRGAFSRPSVDRCPLAPRDVRAGSVVASRARNGWSVRLCRVRGWAL